MRHIYQGTFKDQNGAVVGSSTTSDGNPGTITVYLAGTDTLASVYAASTGGAAINSVSTDAYGYFYFWVDDTVYAFGQLFKIVLTHPDFIARTYDNIDIMSLTTTYVNGLISAATSSGIPGALFTPNDDTVVIQAECDDSLIVDFGDPSKSYVISDSIQLRSGHRIYMRGCTITQTTADKPIFKATSKDNVWIICDGGVLYGEGTWSNAWTSNVSQMDHGITFLGCTRSGIVNPIIKNMAHSGICIKGGYGIKIINPHIEGTHAYSTPLTSGDNFQNGIYITDDAVYGTAEYITITTPDISGVAQGILRELQVLPGNGTEDTSLNIVSPIIHDIPGQHAFYLMGGKVTITGANLSNIELDGFKYQSGDSGKDIYGFTCTGATAYNIGANLFDIAVIALAAGSVSNVIVSAVGHDITGYGLAVSNKVKNVDASLQLTNIGCGAYLSGANMHDIDVKLTANSVATSGVLVTATSSDGIRISPVLRECNTDNDADSCGIKVNSASADVEIFDPVITDSATQMNYGIFNAIDGSIVRVRGSVEITGAKSTAIRAIGKITEFPTEATLEGTSGAWTGQSSVSSSQTVVNTIQSTTASNVVLWHQLLEDESAYLIRAELIGKLADSSERKAVVVTGLFYRNAAGIATIQSAVDVDVVINSASFTGNYSLEADTGNGVWLIVNSAAAVVYDWSARVTVTNIVS